MLQRRTLRKVLRVDKEKIGLTIRKKKYIHARIIAHEVRLKRIEDYLNMPALEVPPAINHRRTQKNHLLLEADFNCRDRVPNNICFPQGCVEVT